MLYWSFLNTFVQVCLSSSSWLPTCPCPPLFRQLSLCPFSCLLFVLPLLSALPGLSVCLVLPVLSVVYVFSVYPSCLSIFLVLSTLSVSLTCLIFLSSMPTLSVAYVFSVCPFCLSFFLHLSCMSCLLCLPSVSWESFVGFVCLVYISCQYNDHNFLGLMDENFAILGFSTQDHAQPSAAFQLGYFCVALLKPD